MVSEAVGDQFYDLIGPYLNSKSSVLPEPLAKLDPISLLEELLKQGRLAVEDESKKNRLFSFGRRLLTEGFFKHSYELDQLAAPADLDLKFVEDMWGWWLS